MAAGRERDGSGAGARRAGQIGLAGFSPAYFGLVMATGIVSLAAHQQGMPGFARVLFLLNCVFYVMVWGLSVARAWRHTPLFLQDAADHVQAWGFFTVVAGSGILGEQFLVIGGSETTAWVLWGVTLALWIFLTYAVFLVLIIKPDKPPLARGIHGGWLLAVVATQSLASLGMSLSPLLAPAQQVYMAFFALALWLWGGMLYIWMMALIFYRSLFFPLSPQELVPPYWITMGAMAISVLAGSSLIAHAPGLALLTPLLPFLKGFTLLFWAAGSWWIPMLLALGVWRHGCRRYPLRYDALYWGAVFPLGMYSASTQALDAALDLGFLQPLARFFLYAAILAWLAALAGWFAKVVGGAFRSESPRQ